MLAPFIIMLAMAQGCGRRESLLSSEIIRGEKVLRSCEEPVCTSYLPEMSKQYEEAQVIQVSAATWRLFGPQHGFVRDQYERQVKAGNVNPRQPYSIQTSVLAGFIKRAGDQDALPESAAMLCEYSSSTICGLLLEAGRKGYLPGKFNVGSLVFVFESNPKAAWESRDASMMTHDNAPGSTETTMLTDDYVKHMLWAFMREMQTIPKEKVIQHRDDLKISLFKFMERIQFGALDGKTYKYYNERGQSIRMDATKQNEAVMAEMLTSILETSGEHYDMNLSEMYVLNGRTLEFAEKVVHPITAVLGASYRPGGGLFLWKDFAGTGAMLPALFTYGDQYELCPKLTNIQNIMGTKPGHDTGKSGEPWTRSGKLLTILHAPYSGFRGQVDGEDNLYQTHYEEPHPGAHDFLKCDRSQQKMNHVFMEMRSRSVSIRRQTEEYEEAERIRNRTTQQKIIEEQDFWSSVAESIQRSLPSQVAFDDRPKGRREHAYVVYIFICDGGRHEKILEMIRAIAGEDQNVSTLFIESPTGEWAIGGALIYPAWLWHQNREGRWEKVPHPPPAESEMPDLKANGVRGNIKIVNWDPTVQDDLRTYKNSVTGATNEEEFAFDGQTAIEEGVTAPVVSVWWEWQGERNADGSNDPTKLGKATGVPGKTDAVIMLYNATTASCIPIVARQYTITHNSAKHLGEEGPGKVGEVQKRGRQPGVRYFVPMDPVDSLGMSPSSCQRGLPFPKAGVDPVYKQYSHLSVKCGAILAVFQGNAMCRAQNEHGRMRYTLDGRAFSIQRGDFRKTWNLHEADKFDLQKQYATMDKKHQGLVLTMTHHRTAGDPNKLSPGTFDIQMFDIAKIALGSDGIPAGAEQWSKYRTKFMAKLMQWEASGRDARRLVAMEVVWIDEKKKNGHFDSKFVEELVKTGWAGYDRKEQDGTGMKMGTCRTCLTPIFNDTHLASCMHITRQGGIKSLLGGFIYAVVEVSKIVPYEVMVHLCHDMEKYNFVPVNYHLIFKGIGPKLKDTAATSFTMEHYKAICKSRISSHRLVHWIKREAKETIAPARAAFNKAMLAMEIYAHHPPRLEYSHSEQLDTTVVAMARQGELWMMDLDNLHMLQYDWMKTVREVNSQEDKARLEEREAKMQQETRPQAPDNSKGGKPTSSTPISTWKDDGKNRPSDWDDSWTYHDVKGKEAKGHGKERKWSQGPAKQPWGTDTTPAGGWKQKSGWYGQQKGWQSANNMPVGGWPQQRTEKQKGYDHGWDREDDDKGKGKGPAQQTSVGPVRDTKQQSNDDWGEAPDEKYVAGVTNWIDKCGPEAIVTQYDMTVELIQTECGEGRFSKARELVTELRFIENHAKFVSADSKYAPHTNANKIDEGIDQAMREYAALGRRIVKLNEELAKDAKEEQPEKEKPKAKEEPVKPPDFLSGDDLEQPELSADLLQLKESRDEDNRANRLLPDLPRHDKSAADAAKLLHSGKFEDNKQRAESVNQELAKKLLDPAYRERFHINNQQFEADQESDWEEREDADKKGPDVSVLKAEFDPKEITDEDFVDEDLVESKCPGHILADAGTHKIGSVSNCPCCLDFKIFRHNPKLYGQTFFYPVENNVQPNCWKCVEMRQKIMEARRITRKIPVAERTPERQALEQKKAQVQKELEAAQAEIAFNKEVSEFWPVKSEPPPILEPPVADVQAASASGGEFGHVQAAGSSDVNAPTPSGAPVGRPQHYTIGSNASDASYNVVNEQSVASTASTSRTGFRPMGSLTIFWQIAAILPVFLYFLWKKKVFRNRSESNRTTRRPDHLLDDHFAPEFFPQPHLMETVEPPLVPPNQPKWSFQSSRKCLHPHCDHWAHISSLYCCKRCQLNRGGHTQWCRYVNDCLNDDDLRNGVSVMRDNIILVKSPVRNFAYGATEITEEKEIYYDCSSSDGDSDSEEQKYSKENQFYPEQAFSQLKRGFTGAQEIKDGVMKTLSALLAHKVTGRPEIPKEIRKALLPECGIWDPGATSDMGSIYAVAIIDETLQRMSKGRLYGKWMIPTAARTFRVANGSTIPASYEVEFKIPLAKIPGNQHMIFRVAAVDTGLEPDAQVPWLFSNESGKKIGALVSSRTGSVVCEEPLLKGWKLQMIKSGSGHWLFPIVIGFIELATPHGASLVEEQPVSREAAAAAVELTDSDSSESEHGWNETIEGSDNHRRVFSGNR